MLQTPKQTTWSRFRLIPGTRSTANWTVLKISSLNGTVSTYTNFAFELYSNVWLYGKFWDLLICSFFAESEGRRTRSFDWLIDWFHFIDSDYFNHAILFHSETTSVKTRKKRQILACDYPGCSAAFSKPCRLEYHMRLHDGVRPYKCNVPGCDASYTRPYHLTRHRSKAHGTKDPSPSPTHERRSFPCKTCPKTFTKHKNLRIHEFVHQKAFPYRCPVDGCGQGFLRKQKLDRHVKSHAGYECPTAGCGETFEKWSLVRKHLSVVHPKRHRCDFCRKDFARLAILNEHLLTHQGEREHFECPDCHVLLVNLAKHIKQHGKRCPARQTRLPCDFPGCGKAFLKAGMLIRHKGLHERTRWFSSLGFFPRNVLIVFPGGC